MRNPAMRIADMGPEELSSFLEATGLRMPQAGATGADCLRWYVALVVLAHVQAGGDVEAAKAAALERFAADAYPPYPELRPYIAEAFNLPLGALPEPPPAAGSLTAADLAALRP